MRASSAGRALVCIPTRGRPVLLGAVLGCLVQCNGVDFDVLVVDDNDQETVIGAEIGALRDALAGRGRRLGFIRGAMVGSCSANFALGFDVASRDGYDWFIRLDDDVLFGEFYLWELIDGAVSAQAAACGGLSFGVNGPMGRVRTPAGREAFGTVQGLSDSDNLQWYDYTQGGIHDVEHLSGVMAIRVSALAEIGGVDWASYRNHRDDTDTSYRLHVSGRRVVFNTLARNLHLRAGAGGVRAVGGNTALADHRTWVKRTRAMKKGVCLTLGHGLGDGIAALPAIRAFVESMEGRVPVSVCAPWAKLLLGGASWLDETGADVDALARTWTRGFSIYEWCAERRYSGNIQIAYFEALGLAAPIGLVRPVLEMEFLPEGEDRGDYVAVFTESGGQTYDLAGRSRNKDLKMSLKGIEEASGLKCYRVVAPEDSREERGIENLITGDIREAIGIIRNAAVVVTCDTYAQHVAAAMSVPCVTVWCRTRPEQFGYDFPERRDVVGRCEGHGGRRVSVGEYGERVTYVREELGCCDGQPWAMDAAVCNAVRHCSTGITAEGLGAMVRSALGVT